MKRIAGRNLVLIGFMGAGKSEVGRLLAAALNRRLVDTDQVIVERAGMAVTEIFQKHGEAGFREREKELIRELSGQKGLVVATGGAAVTDSENASLLKVRGFVVWLKWDPGEITERLAGDTKRPLLRSGKSIGELYRAREESYRLVADVSVETANRTPLEVVEEILRLVR